MCVLPLPTKRLVKRRQGGLGPFGSLSFSSWVLWPRGQTIQPEVNIVLGFTPNFRANVLSAELQSEFIHSFLTWIYNLVSIMNIPSISLKHFRMSHICSPVRWIVLILTSLDTCTKHTSFWLWLASFSRQNLLNPWWSFSVDWVSWCLSCPFQCLAYFSIKSMNLRREWENEPSQSQIR